MKASLTTKCCMHSNRPSVFAWGVWTMRLTVWWGSQSILDVVQLCSHKKCAGWPETETPSTHQVLLLLQLLEKVPASTKLSQLLFPSLQHRLLSSCMLLTAHVQNFRGRGRLNNTRMRTAPPPASSPEPALELHSPGVMHSWAHIMSMDVLYRK